MGQLNFLETIDHERVHCFYHNDIDGRCAGFQVAKYFENCKRENFHEVNYADPLPLGGIKSGDTVFFVDYCFTEKTISVIDKLICNDVRVIWIDHHEQSCELSKKGSQYVMVKGIRSKELSGAALTWLYFNAYKMIEFDRINPFVINVGNVQRDMPAYIRYVDDYDRWIFRFKEDTEYFKIGLESRPYDVFDYVWEKLDKDIEKEEYLQRLLLEGETIKRHIDAENAKYLHDYGYETIIDGFKCLAVNKKTNSWIFGDKINEYPICMVYAFNGEQYVYSIFTKDPNIDCSLIAAKMGGGGHRSAAGFTSKELLFKKKGE